MASLLSLSGNEARESHLYSGLGQFPANRKGSGREAHVRRCGALQFSAHESQQHQSFRTCVPQRSRVRLFHVLAGVRPTRATTADAHHGHLSEQRAFGVTPTALGQQQFHAIPRTDCVLPAHSAVGDLANNFRIGLARPSLAASCL